MTQQHKKSGFTIVELLIVIVVIGILVTIIVVAYNGLQTRANTTTIMSDLANSATKMGGDNATNGSYSLTMSAVDSGNGLPASSGTVYQYHSTGKTYCITGTNHNITYTISDTTPKPVPGGCAGDPTNGDIANLVTNPGFENDMSGWGSTWLATPVSRVTSGSGIVSGTGAFEINVSTANASGGQYNFSNLQTNTPYTVSGYVTLISGDQTNLNIRAGDGSGTRSYKSIASSLVVDQPVRVSLSWTSSSTSPNGGIQFWRNGTSAASGIIRIDNVMITQGSALYNYADGNTTGWIWNGAINNSTSKGPAT